MKCEEVRARCAAYLDGEGIPGERSSLEAHLAECAGCRKEMQAFTLTRELVRKVLAARAAGIAPSTQAWEKVRAQITTPGSAWETARDLFRNPLWRVVVPVALMLLVISSVWGVSRLAEFGGGPTSPALTAVVTPPAVAEGTGSEPPVSFTRSDMRSDPGLPYRVTCYPTYSRG